MKGIRGKKRPLSVPVADWTLEQLGEEATGLLWPNEQTGKPLGWYEHVIEDLVKKAGVRPYSLHDLRTTGNTWLDRYGVDELSQKILMGHSTRSGDVTTIYIKKFTEQLREQVAVYDQIRQKNGW